MHLAVTLPRIAPLRLPFLPAPTQRPVHGALAPPHTLPRHATLRLDNRALRLQVLGGCVWITRDGCPEDVVLETGGVFHQYPGAPVLVHALEDAHILLVAGGPDA